MKRANRSSNLVYRSHTRSESLFRTGLSAQYKNFANTLKETNSINISKNPQKSGIKRLIRGTADYLPTNSAQPSSELQPTNPLLNQIQMRQKLLEDAKTNHKQLTEEVKQAESKYKQAIKSFSGEINSTQSEYHKYLFEQMNKLKDIWIHSLKLMTELRENLNQAYNKMP